MVRNAGRTDGICNSAIGTVQRKNGKIHLCDSEVKDSEVIMLGNIVTVTVDRPLGSYHPEHKDMYYPINYGYVEGIIAPDGEEQDAYILGINNPVNEYTGKIIAIVRRLDDVEDKLVIAPEGATYTREEIIKQIEFQEKFFKYEIIM